MKLLNEGNSEMETRTFSVTALPHHLDKLEVLLNYFTILGGIGHSTNFKIWYDGDGNARMEVSRVDGKKKTELSKLPDMEERMAEYMNDDHDFKNGIGFE